MGEDDLLHALRACLGDDRVDDGAEVVADHAVDIAGGDGAGALAVVRPGDLDTLARAVAVTTSHGHPVVPRGGGHSYTGGVVPARAESVVFDLTAMDRVVEIDPVNRWVRVEAGCTWAALFEAMAPHGLRVPFFGPLSGYRATIGGALSQRAAFFGSARHGFSDASVLGLTVVLANGEVLRTGQGDAGRPHPAVSGPDATGLFLGDCGAFGLKAEACLRLVPVPPACVFASFDFATMAELLAVQVRLTGQPGLAECFGFDPAAHANLARAGFGVMEGAEIVAEVARRPAGLAAAARLLRRGRADVAELSHSLHLVVEGDDEATALARLARAGEIALLAGGRAVPDVIPRVTRARPFRPIKALLGPAGERWLPVHGVFRLGDADAGATAVAETLARHGGEMARHAIRVSTLTVTSGDALILEPQLFWPDALNRFHRRHATADQVRDHGAAPARPEARAAAHALRAELGAAMRRAGAEHLQLGRYYPYEERLAPEMRALLRSLKATLDPRGLMAPGVLFQTAEEKDEEA